MVHAKDFVFLDNNIYQYNVSRDGQTISKEQLKKNFRHFYLIGDRMVKNYLKLPSLTAKRKETLFVFILNILQLMYYSGLVLDKYISKEDLDKLKQLDMLVCKDKDLNEAVQNFKCQRVPFVWLWRKLHLRLSKFSLK